MNLEALAMWSQIVGAVIFVIAVIVIWNAYIAPGVKSYQAAKNAELSEAEARRERMRADVAAARGEIEAADAEGRLIRERVASASARDHDRVIAEAQAEAERIVRNADGELERARLAARAKLRIEFIEKALAKARDEATGRVGDAVNAKLVNATVDDLVRGQN